MAWVNQPWVFIWFVNFSVIKVRIHCIIEMNHCVFHSILCWKSCSKAMLQCCGEIWNKTYVNCEWLKRYTRKKTICLAFIEHTQINYCTFEHIYVDFYNTLKSFYFFLIISSLLLHFESLSRYVVDKTSQKHCGDPTSITFKLWWKNNATMIHF